MSKEQERINELERALIELMVNVGEDYPQSEWSKHLRTAMYDANKVLLNTKKES